MTRLSDEELVLRFHAGEKEAGEEILTRYKDTVRSVARRFFLVGGDTDDLVQEGMCGLYSALTSFSGNSGFSAYAYACVRNRILDAVKKASGKNITFVSEDGDGLATFGCTPEETIIGEETASEFSRVMQDVLSPLEYRAICMYVDGARMPEIAAALNKTYKQTDNALLRAKNKLRRVLVK